MFGSTFPSASGGFSGIYLPVATLIANVAGITVFNSPFFMIGSLVCVSGVVSPNFGAAGAANFRLTLPIPSTFTVTEDLNGNMTNPANLVGSMIPVLALPPLVDCFLTAPGGGVQFYRFIFVYRIK